MMLTPFKEDKTIDYPALQMLTEWYAQPKAEPAAQGETRMLRRHDLAWYDELVELAFHHSWFALRRWDDDDVMLCLETELEYRRRMKTAQLKALATRA